MSQNPFAPDFASLPEQLPVFPLAGVLLLPFGQLPLSIFEPRYVAMIEDALKEGRMIGIIQPRAIDDAALKPALYDVGCAGKITEFSETEDGCYQISLAGICRFRVQSEPDSTQPYRIVVPNWAAFEKDIDRKACLGVDREKLKALLKIYFEQEDMSCDFNKFDDVADGKLMTCLSMICPFEPKEKQVLLEQVCCVARAKLFMSMLEMTIEQGKRAGPGDLRCH